MKVPLPQPVAIRKSLPSSIKDNDVHVWKARLADAGWDGFTAALSADERSKALRFHSSRSQSFYRRCRTALRMLLSAYAGEPAACLRFGYGACGKPELIGKQWQFNVAHSKEMALIAISRLSVGVDLESTDKTDLDLDELSKLIFHVYDRKEFERLPPDKRAEFFYQVWVRKESYVKALGVGLQRDMRTFYVPAGVGSMQDVHDDVSGERGAYQVHDLHAFPGYAASLCLPGAHPLPEVTLSDAEPADISAMAMEMPAA